MSDARPFLWLTPLMIETACASLEQRLVELRLDAARPSVTGGDLSAACAANGRRAMLSDDACTNQDQSTMTIQDSAFHAAVWWAERVRTPPSSMNNGDDVSSGLGALVSAATATPQPDVVVAEFASVLCAKIRSRLWDAQGRVRFDEEDEDWRPSVTLRVDYGPEGMLAEALQAANVRGVALPWKTTMTVYVDRVVVSEGYRSPTVEVWRDDAASDEDVRS